MSRRAVPGRPEQQFTRAALRQRDEFLQRLGGERVAHRQHRARRPQQRNRGEIPDRIVVQFRIKADARGQGTGRVCDHDGVTIGRRMRDKIDGNGPACARAVVDHDLLPKRLADSFQHDAGNEIHHAGRRERYDGADGPRRIIIGPCAGAFPRHRNRSEQTECDARKCPYHCLFSHTPRYAACTRSSARSCVALPLAAILPVSTT